jgi:hypothetical protein
MIKTGGLYTQTETGIEFNPNSLIQKSHRAGDLHEKSKKRPPGKILPTSGNLLSHGK